MTNTTKEKTLLKLTKDEEEELKRQLEENNIAAGCEKRWGTGKDYS
jgi:hypothetical protein